MKAAGAGGFKLRNDGGLVHGGDESLERDGFGLFFFFFLGRRGLAFGNEMSGFSVLVSRARREPRLELISKNRKIN